MRLLALAVDGRDVVGVQEIQNIVHTDEYDMDDGSQLSLLRQGFVCFGQKQYVADIAFY